LKDGLRALAFVAALAAVAAVAGVLGGCDGRADPQLVEAAPDGGVVATQQAIINPGYYVNWSEDKRVSWNASYDHRIALWFPGNGNLTYYFNSSHVGVTWEWSMDYGSTWNAVTNVPESHANASMVSTISVGSGDRGCFTNVGCVAIPTPMTDWTVYHHFATWANNWAPAGTDPVLPHPPVYLRKRYVIECPTTGVYSRPFATGVAVRLDTAPQYLNVAYTATAPASGLFIDTPTWQAIADDCDFGQEAFTSKTYTECVCGLSPPTMCQQWPGQSYPCNAGDYGTAFCTAKCGHG
jgi:hypothetical protein